MAILRNIDTSATIHLVANATFVVAGNNSVSNLAIGSEILTSATIKRVWWGTENANTFWTVKRGSNTVLVLNTSGFLDLSATTPISTDGTGSLVFEKSGNSGFILAEVRKY